MTSVDIDPLRAQFETVAHTTAEKLAEANPHVVSLVAKWCPQDLVPGLSDLDFRIICDDETSPEDWVRIDRALGRIHLDLVAAHPEFNRINEHTAGAGMTVSEVLDPRYHNPEYAVWHEWCGRRNWMPRLRAQLAARPFDEMDEQYHLEKFLGYYSPYIHGIDPPINLGRFEAKYPLHSRCWHYFAPAFLSAASLLARRNLQGKWTALRWLKDNGYVVKQSDAVCRQVDAHYETPELHDPSALEAFEKTLFDAFQTIFPAVRDSVRYVSIDRDADATHLKRQLSERASDPLAATMEIVRFARIRACRYHFYVNAPSHFDSSLQMVAELKWIRKLTYHVAIVLGSALGHREFELPDSLCQLGVNVSAVQSDAIRHAFAMGTLTEGHPAIPEMFRTAVDLFPHYYVVLESALAKLSARALADRCNGSTCLKG